MYICIYDTAKDRVKRQRLSGMYICVFICVYVYMCVHMYVYVHMYTCIYVYMKVQKIELKDND
jgi:hypothetical protein